MKPPPIATPSLFGAPVEASLADGLAVGDGVRWIQAGGGGPALGYAQVVQVSAAGAELELEQVGRFSVGTRLVLEPREGRGQRWIVVVTGVSGRAVRVRPVYAPPVERREYPRLPGEIALRYVVSPGADAASAWMRGGPMGDGARQPSPRMEFSVTGLAFDDAPLVREAAALLMEIGVADGRARWRCVARVIRVLALPGAQPPGATHRIAVQFEQIPQPATLALVDYTMRVQEALTEGGL